MSDLFLPFTPAGLAMEEVAIEVKHRLGLGPYDPVDPFAVLQKVPAKLVPMEALGSMRRVSRRLLLGRASPRWSAVGMGPSPADGSELILLNPNHHEHRRRVSLMEEIVHIIRGHPRVALRFDGNGAWSRPYDEHSEEEAYGVGAACIIPYRPLFNRVSNEARSAKEIAAEFHVSVKYVRYRINRAGLNPVYEARRRTAARS